MMTHSDAPRPYWLYYIAVDAIDAVIERVKAGGGEVLHGPMEVPGGAWIIQGRDPQGALFALVAPKR
jgi:predicted enzyme related to lactoylglutathione lyase